MGGRKEDVEGAVGRRFPTKWAEERGASSISWVAFSLHGSVRLRGIGGSRCECLKR